MHSLESRCLRCFSQQTLLRWALVGHRVQGVGPALLHNPGAQPGSADPSGTLPAPPSTT